MTAHPLALRKRKSLACATSSANLIDQRFLNAFGAITHAYGGATAIELGITSPGGATAGVVPWSHSTKVVDGKGKQ
ncbi:polymorphic toxin type 22 domain-containing protein [Cupriavidus oxalaticus]|uniref:polymorphic toxin type 22 domain-containing protein n=1 Tax=Cupriavidus oxalaticus TaxID=96344 RepID=UPI003D173591